MCTRETLSLIAGALLLAGCASPGPGQTSVERYGIGRTASAEEIRGWDIDVRADGAGLPPGSGTVAEGRKVFEEKCVACHGARGAGATGPRLTGGIGTLASKSPVRTVGSFWPYATTVFDYVRRSMPWDRPLSLSDNEVYAVTAYLLSVDGLVPADGALDRQSLPQVRMPNRDGFVTGQEATIRAPRCMTNC
jgi:cytochrome c